MKNAQPANVYVSFSAFMTITLLDNIVSLQHNINVVGAFASESYRLQTVVFYMIDSLNE